MKRYFRGLWSATKLIGLVAGSWFLAIFLGRLGFILIMGGSLWSPFLHIGSETIILFFGGILMIIALILCLPFRWFKINPKVPTDFIFARHRMVLIVLWSGHQGKIYRL